MQTKWLFVGNTGATVVQIRVDGVTYNLSFSTSLHSNQPNSAFTIFVKQSGDTISGLSLTTAKEKVDVLLIQRLTNTDAYDAETNTYYPTQTLEFNIRDASETETGIVQFATQAEVDAREDINKAVKPSQIPTGGGGSGGGDANSLPVEDRPIQREFYRGSKLVEITKNNIVTQDARIDLADSAQILFDSNSIVNSAIHNYVHVTNSNITVSGNTGAIDVSNELVNDKVELHGFRAIEDRRIIGIGFSFNSNAEYISLIEARKSSETNYERIIGIKDGNLVAAVKHEGRVGSQTATDHLLTNNGASGSYMSNQDPTVRHVLTDTSIPDSVGTRSFRIFISYNITVAGDRSFTFSRTLSVTETNGVFALSGDTGTFEGTHNQVTTNFTATLPVIDGVQQVQITSSDIASNVHVQFRVDLLTDFTLSAGATTFYSYIIMQRSLVVGVDYYLVILFEDSLPVDTNLPNKMHLRYVLNGTQYNSLNHDTLGEVLGDDSTANASINFRFNDNGVKVRNIGVTQLKSTTPASNTPTEGELYTFWQNRTTRYLYGLVSGTESTQDEAVFPADIKFTNMKADENSRAIGSGIATPDSLVSAITPVTLNQFYKNRINTLIDKISSADYTVGINYFTGTEFTGTNKSTGPSSSAPRYVSLFFNTEYSSSPTVVKGMPNEIIGMTFRYIQTNRIGHIWVLFKTDNPWASTANLNKFRLLFRYNSKEYIVKPGVFLTTAFAYTQENTSDTDQNGIFTTLAYQFGINSSKAGFSDITNNADLNFDSILANMEFAFAFTEDETLADGLLSNISKDKQAKLICYPDSTFTITDKDPEVTRLGTIHYKGLNDAYAVPTDTTDPYYTTGSTAVKQAFVQNVRRGIVQSTSQIRRAYDNDSITPAYLRFNSTFSWNSLPAGAVYDTSNGRLRLPAGTYTVTVSATVRHLDTTNARTTDGDEPKSGLASATAQLRLFTNFKLEQSDSARSNWYVIQQHSGYSRFSESSTQITETVGIIPGSANALSCSSVITTDGEQEIRAVVEAIGQIFGHFSIEGANLKAIKQS